MDNNVVAVQPNSTDPHDVVSFTQHMRYRMIDELTSNGTNLSNNVKETMQLLRDMDASALTTRKLDIDQKATDNQHQALESFSRLEALLGGRNPFELREGAPLPVAQRVHDPLPADLVLPEVTLLEGEDTHGEQPLSIHKYVPQED